MSTLSSLLVQRGVASMRAVEAAISRQVLYGGDLVTNLLELGSGGEAELTATLAESLGLSPAPGRLQPASPEVLRTIPGDLARRHGVFPLELQTSSERAHATEETLVLATAAPLATAVEDDLSFALGVRLEQRAAPLVRVHQALADHYGVALEPRYERLVTRLDKVAAPAAAAAARAQTPIPGALSAPPVVVVREAGGAAAAAESADEEPAPPSAGRRGWQIEQAAPHEDAAPAAPAAQPPDLVIDAEPPPAAPVVGGAMPRDGVEASSARAEQGPKGARALKGWLRRTARELRDAPDEAAAPAPAGRVAARGVAAPAVRRKGPFTAAVAEDELSRAATTDAVLGVFFAFSQQYFEYAALFIVHGDLAAGRTAAGPGADPDRMAKIGVPLDLPSVLSTARGRRAPVVAPLSGNGIDDALRRDLGRDHLPRVDAAMIPVVVRGRVVALLYGDDGDAPAELSGLGDVVAMSGLTATALERLIVLRKRGRAGAPRSAERSALSEHPSSPEGRSSSERDADHVDVVDHAAEGPLTARTRAALLELSHVGTAAAAGAVKAADHGPLAGSEPPLRARADPGAGAAVAGQRMDALAQAFGLRGTGVEVDPDAQVNALFSSGRSGGAPPVAASAHVIARPADSKVSPTAETMQMQSVEIPDLDVPPPRPAPPSSAPPPAPEDRPSWTGDPALDPDFDDEEYEDASSLVVDSVDIRHRAAAPHAPAAQEAGGRHAEPAHGGGAGRREGSASPQPRMHVAVDLRAEYASLLQRLLEGGEAGERAFGELVRHGEAALQVIVARFPGPMRVDRHRVRDHLLSHEASAHEGGAGSGGGLHRGAEARAAHRLDAVSLPKASECGPILELIVAIRRPALPFMTVRSSSHDPEVRFWATHVLGELPYPEAANAVLPRLFDDDAAVRRIARRSAAALSAAPPAGAPILQGLGHIMRDTAESMARRIAAIETMGEIRAAALVPPLMGALSDPHEPVGEAAARALSVVTREDFGRDVRRWSAWWAKNADRHRVEWLIDALTHDKASLRRAAGDELKAITKEYLGYYDDLPRKERESAQERYRAWWTAVGRARFQG